MQKVLLIGATGQLGTAVFQKLAQSGQYDIRILIREDSQYEHLMSAEPEIVFGDLKDGKSVHEAVEGSEIIITTANSAAPRKKEDTFYDVDIMGYQTLIDAAKIFGVKQFIYTSINPGDPKWNKKIPLVRSKVETEAYLKNSGVPHTIFQPSCYMDIYFAFLGTTIPAQNEVAPLVNRPFKFMQNFYNGVKDNMDNGKIGIIGSGLAKHSYITIDNVAFLLGRIHPSSRCDEPSHSIGRSRILVLPAGESHF